MTKIKIKPLTKTTTDKLLIYLGFISIFLPYYISFIYLFFASVFIFIKKRNTDLFKVNKIPWLLVFIVYSAAVAALNQNYNGILYSVFILLLCYYCIYVKSVITPKIFENCLSLSCLLGGLTAIIGIADKILFSILHSNVKHRTTLYFFNCNYLATILAIVVIICAYKIILSKGKFLFYFITALLCIVTMYFTGSMFVWIEVYIGIAFLLGYTRKYQLLSIVLLALATVLIVLYCAPEIIPRSGDFFRTIDNRVGIWKVCIDSIKSAPIFGRGFMAYKHVLPLYPKAYPTSHSHSILLEPLMDFGVVGCTLILIYLVNLFRRLFVCRNAQSKYFFSSLIIALIFSLLAHGTTDLTFLWSQTGLFYGLLICGLGPEERLLNI